MLSLLSPDILAMNSCTIVTCALFSAEVLSPLSVLYFILKFRFLNKLLSDMIQLP
jgi:hypothetical protein